MSTTAPETDQATTAETETDQPTAQDAWWVYIVRDYSADLAVGPYLSENVVNAAFESSLLIDGFCEEDCLDAWVESGEPDEKYECVIIDPADPDHFGR